MDVGAVIDRPAQKCNAFAIIPAKTVTSYRRAIDNRLYILDWYTSKSQLQVIRVLNGPFIRVDGTAGVHTVGINDNFFFLFFFHFIHLNK